MVQQIIYEDSVPDDWTKNTGANRRALAPGMEIKLPSGDVFLVESVGPAGASVVSVKRNPVTITAVDGTKRTFMASGRRMHISLHSEVFYRRHIDGRPPDMIQSLAVEDEDHTGRKDEMTEGTNVTDISSRKSKVGGLPVSTGRKAKTKTKTAKGKSSTKLAGTKKERKPKTDQVFSCLCGCGGKTGKYFVAGHDARFKGWLTKAARGDSAPKDLMSAELVRALGPWTKKGNGQVPAKKYQDLRPELS